MKSENISSIAHTAPSCDHLTGFRCFFEIMVEPSSSMSNTGCMSFVMCWTCGLVVPLREAKKQGKISGITGIDILQNPFDQGRGIVLGIDDKHRYQRLKHRKNKHPDQEVQKHLDDGYELTSYISSMPT